MSDILSIQTPYADDDTVTSTNLNNLVSKATFTSAVVDGSTTQLNGAGSVIVRDGGITKPKLAVNMQGALELVGTDAYVGGNKTGATRGDESLDIQSDRNSNSASVASGTRAIAIGRNVRASSGNSTGLGQSVIASGENSVAIGPVAQATALRSIGIGSIARATGTNSIGIGNFAYATRTSSIAIGSNATSTAEYALAIGHEAEALANNTIAIGRNLKNNGTGGSEFGSMDSLGNRTGSVRAQNDGMVSFTRQNPYAVPTPWGGAPAGSETNGTLGEGMFTIGIDVAGTPKVNLFYNNAGQIMTLFLGNLT